MKPNNRWKCDECGFIGFWTDQWWSYGSVLMVDEIPDDVPTLCSDLCKEQFEARRKSGEIEVPRVKPHGYSVRIIGKRRGY